MKKIVLTGAALLLSASILGGCGNEDTASKTSAEAKQEAPTQKNVKELAFTTDADKQTNEDTLSIAKSYENMSSEQRDKSYKGISKENAAEMMENITVKHVFGYNEEEPVSDYRAFLSTYTGENNYYYTKESKEKAEKVLSDLKPLADDFLKSTGEKDATKLNAILIGGSTKIKDKGNNQYEVQSKFDVRGENSTKQYIVTSDAVFNNIIGVMQAKNFSFKQSN